MDTEFSPVEFKDRSTGLTIFGILTVLIGAVWALLILLMIVGLTIAPPRADIPQSQQMIMLGAIIHGSFAIVLVWLGIGSIKARRWARAILLILSWSCLIVGLISTVFMIMMAPQFFEAMKSAQPVGRPEISDSARAAGLAIMELFLFFLFVVLPLIWLLFYSSKHVKATCEARDPVVRWTDRCPLPVLAASLWMVCGAATMLILPLSYHGIFPFFGTFLTAPLGTMFCIFMGLLWAYSAYAVFKLNRLGWWLILVSVCFSSISAAITYSRYDVMEVYRLMGYPDQQIAQMQKFNFFSGHTMMWSSLIYSVPALVYLFYIRKFFNRPDPKPIA